MTEHTDPQPFEMVHDAVDGHLDGLLDGIDRIITAAHWWADRRLDGDGHDMKGST